MLISRFLIILSLFFSIITYGQTPYSNLRTKKISTRVKTVRIDTLSIVPETFLMPGVSNENYKLDEFGSVLTWIKSPIVDSVNITYRVFSFSFTKPTRRYQYEDVKNKFMIRPLNPGQELTDGKGLFDFGNVSYNGSFGRGVSFGNNQDASVNGVLNLQISGWLADSMQLTAALTDNNIPIQADGNTQQLNEFDQVWIQLKKRGWQLNLGDIDIRRNDAYFLSFFKRLQGIAFQTDNRVFRRGKANTIISGAIAKGKFSRTVFQGLEGNQGPYRLQGPNGELFFIVLAGTERVFLDGELLQRGEDQDYVINYNTAEVTFTPKRMINKDRRIQVEFEYADRNFLNAQLILGHKLDVNERLTFKVNAFSNADTKTSSITQVLSTEQKQFLRLAGDVPFGALFPSVIRDTFDLSRIQYRLTDTIVNGTQYDSVLVYTTIPGSGVYSAAFIDVGPGNGDYIQQVIGANGRTYKWIAPVNGIRQGRFVPATKLIAPRTQQMLTTGMDYRIGKKLLVQSEIAFSRFDINTFSKIDKSDDIGWAGRVKIAYEETVQKSRDPLVLRVTGGYEKVNERFRALERLRPVEFTRDWGLPIFIAQEQEQITDGSIELRKNEKHKLSISTQHYRRGLLFEGWRQTADHTFSEKDWNWTGKLQYSSTDSGFNKGFFLRPFAELKKKFSKWNNSEAGVNYSLEHSEIRNRNTNLVNPFSFSFDIWNAFIRSGEQNTKWKLEFYTRRDRLPVAKQLLQTDRSYNYSASVELLGNEHHQLRMNATYRQLVVYNSQVSNLKPEKSLLGRMEYTVSEFKGGLTGTVLYETGAGQEQRRDFSYFQVPAGQGEYTWNDYNGDGVPQINEFELAAFRDQARYIRIFTPTLDFVKAGYNQFNYQFALNPRAFISPSVKQGFLKWASRLSAQSSLQVFKKEITSGNFLLNPFSKPVQDTSLITLNSTISNTLFYNRTSTVWGWEFTHLMNSARSFLTYGLETRTLRELNQKLRWNISKRWSTLLNTRFIRNQLQTPKFNNRNFLISQFSLEPVVSLQQGTSYRFSLSYKYDLKENKEGLKERAEIHSLIMEMRYNVLSNSTINGRFQYSGIGFTGGSTNTTVAFTMLDALLPGRNFIWNLDFTKRLSNNTEISVQYNGRKPGTGKVIHTGQAAVRALF